MPVEALVRAIKRASEVTAQEEDESEPYKHKYEAADLLKDALAAIPPSALPCASNKQPDGAGTQPPEAPTQQVAQAPAATELELAAAAARVRRGLVLLETDLLPDGQADVEQGLPPLESAEPGHGAAFTAWLLEAYNALGALHSQRGDLEKAKVWLQRAEELYRRVTATGARHAHLDAAVLPIAGQSSASSPPAAAESQAEQPQGTSRSAGGPQEQQEPAAAQGRADGAAADGTAASPAAAAGGADPNGQPSPQAAEPSSSADAGAAAAASQPPLHALLPDNDAATVQDRYTSTLYYMAQLYGHMKLPDRSALYCAATLYRQLASGKYNLDTWVNNCLQLGGYYAKVHAYGLAMYCHAAAKAVADRDVAAGASLGEDIAANIQLAMGRLYMHRLAASHARHVEAKELDIHYPDVSHFPDYLRFQGLSLPAPDTFPWGAAALAGSFEAARDLFNTGMPYFKAASSYYQLDGWVTDHVGILMDMSNMYRCLAGFEADPGRVAAMHRCRAQLLEPLSGALNPTHYPGLSRSVDLELAHVYREISDVRDTQGGQAAKVAAAATSAVKFYNRFLRSFVNDNGQLPDRVDHDNEPYFLMASFGLGRMMHRMRGIGKEAGGSSGGGEGAGGGGGDASYPALLAAAHSHLQWTSSYVKRHGLEQWTKEAQAAEELSDLLVEQLRLRALAARRKGS